MQKLLCLLWIGDLAQQAYQYLKMKLIVPGLTSLKQAMHKATLFSFSFLSTKISLKNGVQPTSFIPYSVLVVSFFYFSIFSSSGDRVPSNIK